LHANHFSYVYTSEKVTRKITDYGAWKGKMKSQKGKENLEMLIYPDIRPYSPSQSFESYGHKNRINYK